MTTATNIANLMISHIAEFFRYMSDNDEQRLYYVMPIQRFSPYAYQNSTIRDVATVCNILDLVNIYKNDVFLTSDLIIHFEGVARNTLQAYHDLYHSEELPNIPEGNIGDIGFFLLLLEKGLITYPEIMPSNWESTKARMIKLLFERQNKDGSITIFFDPRLKRFEKGSEAFYLPEALIGLISCIGSSPEIDNEIFNHVQKAILYCCQDTNREENLDSETATFYTNWQFQLLFHWFNKVLLNGKELSLELNHLEKLIKALQKSEISKKIFGNNIATVEVACFLEGLVYAQQSIYLTKKDFNTDRNWFEKEIDRCIKFLHEVQIKNLLTIKGGFTHSLDSSEARIDVAGHVFSGLSMLLNNPLGFKL